MLFGERPELLRLVSSFNNFRARNSEQQSFLKIFNSVFNFLFFFFSGGSDTSPRPATRTNLERARGGAAEHIHLLAAERRAFGMWRRPDRRSKTGWDKMARKRVIRMPRLRVIEARQGCQIATKALWPRKQVTINKILPSQTSTKYREKA